MTPLTVVLPSLPPSGNHAYAAHWQGGRGLTREAVAWQVTATRAIRAAMSVQGWTIAPKTPLRVTVLLIAPDIHRWDGDNRWKCLADALKRATGVDDAYYDELILRKRRGGCPETHIMLEAIG